MWKILIGVVVTLCVLFAVRHWERNYEYREVLLENSTLIQQQIQNVGKLVVTEGNFAQVFTYEDSKKFYFDVLSAKKKALIVVNAKVSVAYDLRKLETQVDMDNKMVRILSIPEAEVDINPDIEYYDITQDYLNQFDASDYNKIKKRVLKSIDKKIAASKLKSQAQNRLITELSNIFITTQSLGWTLYYEETAVKNEDEFLEILP